MFQAVSDSLKQRVSDEAAKQALGPYSFRDGDLIASLLVEAGFRNINATGLVVHRPLSPVRPSIRKDLLSSTFEMELRAKGDETIDAIVADVEAALEQYRNGDNLVIPQEAHLFQAENAC